MKKNNNYGIASLIFGILSFLFFPDLGIYEPPLIFPILLSLLAIIFGVVGLRKRQTYSIVGLIFGIIGLLALLWVVYLVMWVTVGM
jgi:Na+/phosphate symporter